MEEFVENHLKLLELERSEEISNSQFRLSCSPKALESKGLCLQRMRLSNLRTGLYGRTVAEFDYMFGPPPRDLPANTFSSGDLVGISPEKGPVTSEETLSAVMLRVSARAASLVLDDSANAEQLEDGGMYRLVKMGSDVTYKRIKKGLKNLLAKSQSGPAAHLVDILFGIDVPATTPVLPELKFLNQGLDVSQREAVAFALARPDLAVIHGPPGTGKTTTVIELVRQALLQPRGHRKTRILACAPSNVAVDNLVERLSVCRPQPRIVRLGHAARVMPHIQQFSLEAQLTGSDGWQLVKDVQKEMDAIRRKMGRKKDGKGDVGGAFRLRHEMADLRRELRQRETKALQEIYGRTEVVLSTLTGLHEDKTLQEVEFDVVIIDECSQSVEAACWLALLRSSRCVLAGDHLQLPPTVLSKEAVAGGLELSLMERVLKLYPGEQVTRMLTTQYRMHEDIMGWSAQQFYEGKLSAHPSVERHGLSDLPHLPTSLPPDLLAPVLLIDTAGCGLSETQVESSRGNLGEAELVRHLVTQRISNGLRQADLGVITPYNLQVELIRNRVRPLHPGVEVRTVDGFQGREKEVILLSLVRSNPRAELGFLSEHRRLNVAVTRARRQLVVVCDTETLGRGKDGVVKGFVEYLREKATVVTSAQELIDAGEVDIGSVLESDLTAVEKADAGKKEAGNKKKNKNKNKAKKEAWVEKSPHANSGKPVAMVTGHRTTMTKEEKEEEEETFRQQLLDFLNSDEQEKDFPESLDSRQRAVIHELSEALSLVHVSVGEGKNRHLVVKKASSPPPASPSPPPSSDTPPKSPSPPPLHQDPILRQLQQYRQREAQKRQQQQQQQQARKTAPKPRTNSALAQAPDDDFDALLAAAREADGVCAQQDCSTKVRTLGHQCAMCRGRFCTAHCAPESHGCGQAAREAARRCAGREGRLYPGSGVPSKKPDPTRRAHLERRLDKKIDGMAELRKAKDTKKKKK